MRVDARRACALVALCSLAAIVPARAESPDPLGAPMLLGDVAAYANIAGDHLTGSAEGIATQAWVASQLADAGLSTGSDAFTFLRFALGSVSLSVGGEPVDHIAPRFYSGTTGPDGVTAPLVYAGFGSAQEDSRAQADGKIVVVDVPMVDDAVAPSLDGAFTAAQNAGAVGLVAVTEGAQDFPVQEDIDSRQGVQHLPTLFVGKRTGAEVIARAQAGETATLTLTADVGEGCDADVYGVLPGADPARFVIVGTPTSAFVPSASERGAGVAILLGLARHYAALPIAQRPYTMVFVATTGHEIGFLGLPVFIQVHPAWFAAAQAYVHLGASIAAAQLVEAPDGSVVRAPAGDATRLFYVSENPALLPGVQAAFASAGATTGSASPAVRNVGEQAYAYHAGAPIVSISGASYYFHTAGDAVDGVDTSLLASMARGFAGSIDYIGGLPAGSVPQANGFATAAGARQDPNPTPSGGSGTPDPANQPTPVEACP